ncbi:MAG: TonB family protein [Desulfomonilaceae bacterium]
MEKLHCILHPHGRSALVISLPALPPLWSFTRPVADWLGLRRRSPLCREDDFSTENLQFPFDVDYHDSTAFKPGAEPYLDWEFEPGDSDFSHTEPAIPFWDNFFDDPKIIGQPQAEQGLPLGQDLVVENGKFIAVFCTRFSHPRLAVERFRSFAFSFVCHLAALSLFIACPTPSLTGLGGISDKSILVRLIETSEINTPDDPSPASVDSPASLASLARRDPKPEEKTRKESRKEESTDIEAKEVPSKPRTGSRPIEAKSVDRPDLPRKKVLPDHSLEHGPFNDSKSLQDSPASTPSVASPERRGSFKAGNEAETYKDQILSAIHEAAYYPREALRRMAHGKTMVWFTINRDGSLANVAIVAHADSKVLDEAALKIVEKASSHFPPVPDSLMKEQVSYLVPIVFKKGL